MKNTIIVGLALSIFALHAQSQQLDLPAAMNFSSADFAFDGKQLLNSLPLKPDTASVLYCRADVSSEGRADVVNCYSQVADSNLVSATEQSIRSLPFVAASVYGAKVPVRMSFRVAYNQLASGLKASLIPNLGTMQASYGRDYVAPQERLDVSDWYSRYSEHSWEPAEAWLGEGDLARVAAMIETDGQPALIRTVEAHQAYKRDAQIIQRTLKHSRFLPGSVNGKPVAMEYVVAVHYDENHRSFARAH